MVKGNGHSNEWLLTCSTYDHLPSYEECSEVWSRMKSSVSTKQAVDKIINYLGLTYRKESRSKLGSYYQMFKKSKKW